MSGQGPRSTAALQAAIAAELAANGITPFRPVQDMEQAIERARSVCHTCTSGHTNLKALAHHNLRASELGERSYPCTRVER